MTDRAAEVRRVLDRYVVEIVEAYDLCPWAKPARLGGELSVEILWGQPGPEQWVAAGEAMLGRATTAVAMIVAPELAATPSQLRAIRDGVATRITTAGIAHFHPDSPFDLGSPARLVPALRRSPDPLLQLVPLALLDQIRAPPPVADRARQAQIIAGQVAPPRGDVADRIAAANHERVTAELAAVTARLADIADDRRRSYARAGIAVNTGP